VDREHYAIIRTAKIRTLRQLLAAEKHNDRTAEQGVEHADPSRPPELIAGHPDAVKAWEAAMVSKGLDPKPRKGGVVAIEWLATASNAWWETATPEQRAAWKADTLAFVADEMAGPARPGEDPGARHQRGMLNILAAHYHDDESTPHLHILAVPLVEKERAARGRPRKRDAGKPRTTTGPAWSLAAKDILGGPRGRMSELQDDYAAAMEPHGLRRGIPRKETGAFNKAPAHWRAEQAHLTTAMEKDRAIVGEDRRAAEGDRATAIIERTKATATRTTAEQDAAAIIAKAEETGKRRRDNIVANAQADAAAIIAAAQQQAQQMVAKVKAWAEAVKADAVSLGRAISFPDYAADPTAPDARAAVAAAERRKQQEADDQRKRNAATKPPDLEAIDRLKRGDRGGRGRGD
jgi:hypothetical protein